MRAWVAAGITVPLSTVLIVGIVLLTDRLPGILTRSFLSWNRSASSMPRSRCSRSARWTPAITDGMRRTVAGHSALTFLFNTIIIALLVTALSR